MTAETIINKAREFLGVTGSPKGSHNVLFNTAYYGYEVNDKSAYYWCVVFVWYVFRAAGASVLFCNGDKVNRCKTVKSWAEAYGLVVDKVNVRPGDLVLYDWEPNGTPDHIGIATSASDNNGTFTAIEGNVDDAVKELSRNLSKVVMAVRPAYVQEAEPVNCEQCPILEALRTLYNKMKQEVNQ